MSEPKPLVRIYGADWCPNAMAVIEQLKILGVKHEYFNIDTDQEAKETVMKTSKGNIPVIFVGEDFIIDPTLKELNIFLNNQGLMRF